MWKNGAAQGWSFQPCGHQGSLPDPSQDKVLRGIKGCECESGRAPAALPLPSGTLATSHAEWPQGSAPSVGPSTHSQDPGNLSQVFLLLRAVPGSRFHTSVGSLSASLTLLLRVPALCLCVCGEGLPTCPPPPRLRKQQRRAEVCSSLPLGPPRPPAAGSQRRMAFPVGGASGEVGKEKGSIREEIALTL